MKNLALLSIVFMVSLCFAESFLVHEKPKKRANLNQIRQDIADSLGTLIECSAGTIEQEAKIQQKAGKELRALIDGQGRFQKASLSELEKTLADVKREIQRRKQLKASQEELLNLL